MCGIFGIVTSDPELQKKLGQLLAEAAQRLTYRGYDSVGAAVMDDRRSSSGSVSVDLRKDVGRVQDVAAQYHFNEMQGTRGMTQLRWATFGEPSQVNAQPHLDSTSRMVGCHNGNIVNNVDLRQLFIKEGMAVRSMNDGESCVHACERFVARGDDLVTAIRRAHDELLQGDYSFIIGQVAADCLHAIKKGSGLVVGIGSNFTCVSSDLPSILPLTRRIVRMNDGEIVTLWPDRVELRSVVDGKAIQRDPEEVTDTMESVQKGGYAHFMLKEIHEQPTVARDVLHMLDNSPEVQPIVAAMQRARTLYFIACGTSYHACVAGAVFFSQLAGRAVIPVLAPQFGPQYSCAVTKDDVGLFVSQSGETKDVLNALQMAQKSGMVCYSMANVVGSTLTRLTAGWLPLCCGYEISVPATKTFTNQVIALLHLAYRLGKRDARELHTIPQLIEQTIQSVDQTIKAIAAEISTQTEYYCLGFGATYAIALEGALKLKEVTCCHVEGMLSTEFKHGPLSAVHKGYPILFVAAPDDIPLIISGINEVSCRGARALVIARDDPRLQSNASDVVCLPQTTQQITALLAVIPLQLLSYYIGVQHGFDPDFPRNLSKTLTVD